MTSAAPARISTVATNERVPRECGFGYSAKSDAIVRRGSPSAAKANLASRRGERGDAAGVGGAATLLLPALTWRTGRSTRVADDDVESEGFKVTAMRLIPRPTPLPTGIAGWLTTFAGPFLGAVEMNTRDQIVSEVRDLLKLSLCDGQGRWTADYVRLRFAARRR